MLRSVECVVNDRMGFIICCRCECAIVPEFLRTHLWKKHHIFCSAETWLTLTNKHSLKLLDNILEFRNAYRALEWPIEGIPILDGYRCVHCEHYMVRSESMRKHLERHRKENVITSSEGCKVQSPFGGKFKKCFGVADRSVRAAGDGNENGAWTVLSAKLGRKRARLSNVKEEDLRFVSSFVARTRWDILVEDHDWKKLKDLAVTPKSGTQLDRVVKLAFKHFDAISDRLRAGDVLVRRKIRSTGYGSRAMRTADC